MSIKEQAQKFLNSCRVIEPCEVKEGLIVTLNGSEEFEVVRLTRKSNGFEEEVVGVFGQYDIVDEDDDKTVLNFKKEMTKIVGRKRYYVETCVYIFLASEEDPFEDIYEDNFDDAEERARIEAEEEETAEHEFERFLRAQEEM